MIRNLLKQYSIPTPSRIMTDLIALRISQLPADPDAPYKANEGITRLALRDGREIQVTLMRHNHPHILCRDVQEEIKVGLPGAPHYRSVELSSEEQAIIARELHEYQRRSVAADKLRREAESQQNALTIVEGLIA